MDLIRQRIRDAARLREAEARRRVLTPVGERRPGRVVIDGRELVNFASNDYLGLALDPRVTAELRRAAGTLGAGAGASHLLGGHQEAHAALEAALADWTGRERALLFSSGWSAALGAIPALIGGGDTCVQDKLNHACLLDAAILSGARLSRYPHLDVHGAHRQLQLAGPEGGQRRARGEAPAARLLVTDAMFSMDGDLAPLPALADLATRFGAWLMVDEAHSLGVLGPAGAGLTVASTLDATRVPVLMGTLGKALGGFGAFIAGDAELIEHLINAARSWLFTTALPPTLAAATAVAVDLARREDWRRERLQALGGRLASQLTGLGFSVGALPGPIYPLIVGDNARALALAAALKAEGFLVPAIRPPTVPPGTARLRVSLTADHAPADIDRFCAALARAMGQLPPPELPPPPLPGAIHAR